jgi:hypothetical protein
MSPQTHAFQPGNRPCVPAQKRSSLWAFCVSGRCLEVALAGGMKPACGNSPADDGEPAEITRDRRASAILAEGACSCGRQPPSLSIVHRPKRGPIDATSWGRMSSAHFKKRCAVLTGPARELSDGIAGTELQGDGRSSPPKQGRSGNHEV